MTKRTPLSLVLSISTVWGGLPAAAREPSALAQLGAAAGQDAAPLVEAAKSLASKLFDVKGEGNETKITIAEEQLGKLFRVSATIAQADGVSVEPANFVDGWMDADWVIYFNKAEGKVEVLQKNMKVRARPGTAEAKMLERSFSDSLLAQLAVIKPTPPSPAQGAAKAAVPSAPLVPVPSTPKEVHDAEDPDPNPPSVPAAPAPAAASAPAPAPAAATAQAPAESKKDDPLTVSLKEILIGGTDDIFGVSATIVKLNVDPFRPGFSTYRPAESRITSVRAFRGNMEVDVRLSMKGPNDSALRADGKKYFVTVHYSFVELPKDDDYEPRKADQRVGYFPTLGLDYSDPGLKDKMEPTVHYINRWKLEKSDPSAAVSKVKDPVTYWIDETVSEDLHPLIRSAILSWNAAFEKVGLRDALEVRAVKDLPDDERKNFSVHDIANDVVISVFANEEPYAHGPSRATPDKGRIYSAAIRWSDGFVRLLRGHAHEERTKMLTQRLSDWSSMKEEGHVHSALCGCSAKEHAADLERWAAGASSMRDVLKMLPGFTAKDEQDYFEQAFKEITEHEAGHTLGLRHNFKGSRHAGKGGPLTSSVMDYNRGNTPKRGKDGSLEWDGPFFQTEPGAYDLWAIEYGYTPLDGKTPAEKAAALAEIADRSRNRPELQYGTDEDTVIGDPDSRRFDGPGDPVEYAKARNDVVRGMWKRLAEQAKDTKTPIPYKDLRRAMLAGRDIYAEGMMSAGDIIGGLHTSRQTAASEGEGHEDTYVPVSRERQEAALAFLIDEYLDDSKTQIDPALLRRMGEDRRGMLGAPYDVSFRYDHDQMMFFMQARIVERLMNPELHGKLAGHGQYVDDKDKVFKVSEVITRVGKAVWTGVEKRDTGELELSANRQKLQSLHVDELIGLRKSGTREGSIVARQELKDIQARIDQALSSPTVDPVTRGHLEDIKERIHRHFTRPVATTDDLSVMERVGFALRSMAS